MRTFLYRLRSYGGLFARWSFHATYRNASHAAGRAQAYHFNRRRYNGNGYKKGNSTISVKVPAGIDNGQVLTMRGKGNAGKRGGESGDLHIIVSVEEHRILTRDGFDLSLKLYVPFYTLLLGGEVEIPLPKGTTTLKIPELTQSNTIFKLKGKGIKHLNRETHGNLIVTVIAETPKTLSKTDKKAIEELKKSLKEDNFARYKDYKKDLDKVKKD